MKKRLLVIMFFCVLLTGCVSREVYNFERYLKRDNYSCTSHVCSKTLNEAKNIEESYSFDIEHNDFVKSQEFIDYVQKSIITYNYANKLVAVYYNLSPIRFNATYNIKTKEYKCESNDDDKIYESAQCETLKKDIDEVILIADKVLKDSNYKWE